MAGVKRVRNNTIEMRDRITELVVRRGVADQLVWLPSLSSTLEASDHRGAYMDRIGSIPGPKQETEMSSSNCRTRPFHSTVKATFKS